ncbi:MAG: hypothetical protein LBI20_02990 [Holosporales bacterium]|jgi:hypothetical protein|nr:hypothetical protein [Holosporales bacterium]
MDTGIVKGSFKYLTLFSLLATVALSESTSEYRAEAPVYYMDRHNLAGGSLFRSSLFGSKNSANKNSANKKVAQQKRLLASKSSSKVKLTKRQRLWRAVFMFLQGAPLEEVSTAGDRWTVVTTRGPRPGYDDTGTCLYVEHFEIDSHNKLIVDITSEEDAPARLEKLQEIAKNTIVSTAEAIA